MSAPAIGPGICETCGQPLILVSRACTCNPAHGETVHEFRNGKRADCLTYGPAGKCGCPGFTPAGDA